MWKGGDEYQTMAGGWLGKRDFSPWQSEGKDWPLVSVILPVKNEEQYIGKCLDHILDSTYPLERLEVIVVDGESDDRTREIVEGKRSECRILLLENPRGSRASGLNLAIGSAKGEIIIRVDARTMCPPRYIEGCVETLVLTGADNVGGVQRPIANSVTQDAIGLAISHPFGAANAQFRLGRKSGFVDTVYLGCFWRDVFAKVGYFDENPSVISEDSDLNKRIRDAGGTVYLNSDLEAFYYPRETLRDFWRLYFHYGGARAGNVLKHRRLTSWRQAAPVFVLILVILGMLCLVSRMFFWVIVALVSVYVSVDTAVSLHLATKRRKAGLFGRLFIAFPCVHIAYGLGFWKRLLAECQRRFLSVAIGRKDCRWP